MNKAVKWLIGGGIVAAIIGLGSKATKALKTQNTGDKLVIDIINPRVHKVGNPLRNEMYVEAATDVKLKNPSNYSLEITQPFVKILQNGKLLTSNKAENAIIKIAALSESNVNTILFKIKYTQIISMLSSIKFTYPEGTNTLLKKASHIMNNPQDILQKLGLELEYSTYANGFYHSKKTQF